MSALHASTMRRRWACAWLACVLAAPAAAENLLVGPEGQPRSLRDAIRQAQDGDVIDVLPGEYRGEVAVIEQKRLTIRGLGQRPVLHAEGKVAEGKAIFVVRDGEVVIENLEFRGARAPDANGAGIRFEKGRLTVRRCAFFDNENGLLTANFGDAELSIEDSEFGAAPRSVGRLYHLLYVGRIARASITGSRFHSGFEGHLIKSRARQSVIAYNLVHDGPDGQASYEIDLPNGGDALIIGNVIGQAPATQNVTVVAYGAEGRAWPGSRLVMAHNTLINDRLLPAWFLRVFGDRLPEGTEVLAVNNLTVGPGVFSLGAAGRFEGNYPALARMLVDPDTFAFELRPGSMLHGLGVDPRKLGGRDLAPKAEFAFPIGTRAPRQGPPWSPGAFQ
jgi:hypothetical protein